MGTCCVPKTDYQKNYSGSLSNRSSFAVNQSTYDQKFLYFHAMPRINQSMRSLIDRQGDNDDLLHQIDIWSRQLQQQLLYVENPDSSFNKRLEEIRSKLLDQSWGYLLFQIQKVEMHNERRRKLTIRLQGTSVQQLEERQIEVRQYKAQVNLLAEWVLKQHGKIKVSVDNSISTIDLNEVQGRLMVCQPMNLKAVGVLEPIGKIMVRIQYISDVDEFKKQYQSMVKLKLQQLKIASQKIKAGVQEPADILADKLLISKMGQLEQSKLKTSFFDNDFQI